MSDKARLLAQSGDFRVVTQGMYSSGYEDYIYLEKRRLDRLGNEAWDLVRTLEPVDNDVHAALVAFAKDAGKDVAP
jgi:hypothetical protein